MSSNASSHSLNRHINMIKEDTIVRSRVEKAKGGPSYFHFITKKRKNGNKCKLSTFGISNVEQSDPSDSSNSIKRRQTTPYFNKKQPVTYFNGSENVRYKYQQNKKAFLNYASFLKEEYDSNLENEAAESEPEASLNLSKESGSSVFISSDFLEDGQVALHTKDDQHEEPCVIHVKDEQIDISNEPLDLMIMSDEANEEISLESHVHIMESDSEEAIDSLVSSSEKENITYTKAEKRSQRNRHVELKIAAENLNQSTNSVSTNTDMEGSKLSNKEVLPNTRFRNIYGQNSKYSNGNFESTTGHSTTNVKDKDESSADSGRPSKKYRCKLCKKLFSTFVEARHHAKHFHSSAVYEQNLRNKTASPFFHCPDCDRNFPTERGRNKHHVMIHLKSKPLRCSDCSQIFSTFRPMERHLRDVHDKTPEIFCSICDEEFVLRSSLDHHLDAAHSSDSKELGSLHLTSVKKREIPCPICQKIFRNVRDLQDHHLLEHNGMAYNCNHCKIYRTKSATALKRHLAQVHKAVNLDLYSCVICKSGYQIPQDLEDHYVCVHKRPLNNHCLLCGKKFACSEMLRFHKGLHRAFTCTFCYLGFMKEETLEEHLKTVHSNDWPKETDALFEEKFEFSESYEIDCPIMELPEVSNETDNTSKVLEINFDGSIEIKEGSASIIDNIKDDAKRSTENSSSATKENDVKAPEYSEAVDIDSLLKSIRVKDLPKKVNCPVCSKTLTSKFLKTHLLSHQGSFPHKCHACPKAYAQGTLLRKHMKSRHPVEFLKMGNKNPKKKEIQCEYCEKAFFDVSKLEDHLWEHMDEKYYKCETCSIKFGMKSNWLEHFKSHYFKDEKLCTSCGRAFKSVGFYREHISKCLTNWKCEKCGHECDSEEQYRKHQKLFHHGRGAMFKCKECEKTFPSRPTYEDHLLVHSSEKKFSCDQCSKVFKRRRPLNEHIQRTHSHASHTCNYCSLSFNSAVDLQLHKKEHLIETPCPECAIIFMSQKTLDNHIAVHHCILEQDYICSHCAQVFERQSDLKMHLPKHYTSQVFVCNVNNCHKVFKKELLLRSHTARLHSHLEYFCHICLKKFILDTDLQRHLTTHNIDSSVRSLKGKTKLKSKESLQSQMDNHPGELPFECSFCGIKLQHKHNIFKHVETIHDISENISDYIIVSRWKCSICEKLLMSHNSMLKHLQQHSCHGVNTAEGNLIKFALSLPVHSVSSNTPIESLNVWWEDLIPSLKVQLIEQRDQLGHGTELKVTASTWQCPVCFVMTNSEENMKKHLLSSTQCQETLLTSLTEKLTTESLSHKLEEKESEGKEVQYVILGNDITSKIPENSGDSFVFSDNGLQIVVDGEERNLSEFLNNDDEIITTLPVLENLERKRMETIEDSVQVELSNSILSPAGIFIQMKDGQLIIPDMDSGVTQYHLVNEEIDDQGMTESTYEII